MNLAATLDFVKRRMADSLGIVLAGFSLLCLVAFLSYNPADPSFNNANDNLPANMGGYAGAFIAGPMLAMFGLGSIIFIIIPPAWAWILLVEKSLPRWWLRITAFILCLPLISGAFSLVDMLTSIPEIWPANSYGGVIGSFVKSDLQPIIGLPVFVALSVSLSLITLYLSAGLLREEWAAIFRVIFGFFATMVLGIKNIYSLISYTIRKAKRDTDERLSRKERKKESNIKDDKPRFPIIKKKVVEISARKKRQLAREQDTQTSLDLRVPDSYELPPLNLLRTPPGRLKKNSSYSESSLEQNARLLEKVLDDFGVNGSITAVRPGPVVTLYELEPSPGTKSSRVIGLADDIARSMSAVAARIAVVPGKNAIGIELPNSDRETVYFRELLETEEFEQCTHNLSLVLGKTIEGDPFIMDLAKMPHLLVAGTTGSGKSVSVNAMILSLLYRYTPDQCRFIMIDPKMLELSVYEGIPHLLSPVVTEPGKAVVALKWTVKEMENRYRLMSNLGVRNIEGYNKRIAEAKKSGEELKRTVQTGYDLETGKPTFEKVPLEMNPLPFIVVIVDEMADLMIVAGKDIEASVQRLAQMARAAGIHIIMATQRPSVDVITGVIKANFPTRISFQVTSRIDSRTILNEQGAEQLLGMGDMLYMAGGSRITRVHGPYVDDKEVKKVVDFWKEQGSPVYVEDVTTAEDDEFSNVVSMGMEGGDDLYNQAVQIVCRDGRASTSYIQRCLKIGYNRAANIIEQMEKDGIVSPPNHTGKREVLTGSG